MHHRAAQHRPILLSPQVELLRLYPELEFREQVEMLGHIRAHKHRHHLLFQKPTQ